MTSKVNQLKHRAKKIATSAIRPMFLDRGGDHRDTFFVAGTERSGTTWLADLINSRKQFRLIFEPFWANRVPECKSFSAQQYLRPDNSSPEFLDSARKILSGSLRNLWFDKYHRAFVSKKRIVKDVRANLLLGWLAAHFTDMPIVLIVRHPCAVASSQKQARHRFGNLKDHFLNQSKLIEDYLEPFLGMVENLSTPFEERVFRWCIQTFVPLKQFNIDQIHVVFYEELCARPEEALEPLFRYLELPFDFTELDLLVPSPVSRSDSAVVTGESLVDKWRDFVTSAEISSAMKILQSFGLDTIYSDSSMPASHRLKDFMGS